MSSSLALYSSFKIRFLETFPSRLKDLVWHLLQGTSHGYKPFHISTEILFPLFSVLGCNFMSRRVLDSYFFYSKLKVFDSIVFWVLLFLRRNVCLLHWGPFLIASASLNVFLLSPVASNSRIMWLVRLSLFLSWWLCVMMSAVNFVQSLGTVSSNITFLLFFFSFHFGTPIAQALNHLVFLHKPRCMLLFSLLFWLVLFQIDNLFVSVPTDRPYRMQSAFNPLMKSYVL